MAPHLSRDALARAFSSRGAQPVAASPHLLRCTQCLDLAVEVVEELRRDSRLAPSGSWAAIVEFLEEEKREGLNELCARAWWTDLSGLSPEQQWDRFRSVAAMQTKEMVETVIEKASLMASSDPHLAEQTAINAQRFAGLLAETCPQEAVNDLRGKAKAVAANCRRLAADWSGAQAALKEARSFLQQGTGDPAVEACLLSISASLASDTGHLEAAQRWFAQAAERYESAKDQTGLAGVKVQEAGTLLAGRSFEAALNRAKEALRTPADARLEMMARSIITECLIELERPAQALSNFRATRPLYEQFWGRRTQLKVGFLEARLLDAFGYSREAEKVYREVITSFMDEGMYKSAINLTLTLFETLCKRGALGKAERLCEEACKLLDTPLAHPQMKQVWEELLAQVRSQAVTASRILDVRLHLLKHWSVPAAVPSGQPEPEPVAEVSGPLLIAELAAAAQREALQPQPEPFQPFDGIAVPTEPALLANGGYQKIRDSIDRTMIAAALRHTGGHLGEAAQLLGLSRNGLEAKAEKLGLGELVTFARAQVKPAGRRRRARHGRGSSR